MKAVVFHEHGGLEVLQYEEVPTPPISPTEALLRVRACALNHLDIWVRQGMPKVTIPLPHILGSYMGGRKELWEVLRLAETGQVRPVVDSVFPLPEAAAAQERMLSRKIFGKVVLTP